MNNAFVVKNLRKNYKNFLLKDISFSLPTGYIMGFVGQNGAGKTTTIRLMLNMTDRAGGEISLLGMDNLRDEHRIKQDVGVVLDEIYFVNNWNVRESRAGPKTLLRPLEQCVIPPVYAAIPPAFG